MPEPTPSRVEEPRVSGPAAAALYLALSLVYFGRALLPGNMVFGTDTFAGGYAFYELIARELSAGRLPSWIPHVYGGLPLFANPGSTFYPVHLLASLLLPAWKIFPVVMVTQFWLAGLGMFVLARELGCRPWVAFVTGVLFQFTGVTLSWVYAGHDGRIIVATLAPLALALLRRGLRTGSIGSFAGAAAALGAALLSFQIQVAWYLLLAGALVCLAMGIRLRHTLPLRAVLARIALALAVGVSAFALSAVNFLPFAGYVGASPRASADGRGYDYSVSYSATPMDLAGLLVPELPGSSVTDPLSGAPSFPPYRGPNPIKLHTEYVGVLTVVLALSGLGVLRRSRAAWALLAASAFFLTLALGGHTPLYRLYLAVLPGLSRFRAPDLALYVVVLCWTALAGLALEALAAARSASDRRPRLWGVASVGGCLAIAAFAMAALSPPAPEGPTVRAGFLRVALVAAALSMVLFLWLRRVLSPRVTALLLTFVALADLWSIGKRFLFLTPPPSEVFAEDAVAAFLRSAPQPHRTWVLPIPQPYRGGGNGLMRSGLQQLGGEHPVPLQRYLEYVGTSRRAMVDWHNVMADAHLANGALAFQTRPALLAAANVRYLLSTVPLAVPGLREVGRGDRAHLYENESALPRAWLVSRAVTVQTSQASLEKVLAPDWRPQEVAFVESPTELGLRGGPTGDAELLDAAATRLAVRTRSDVPALLVLAENHYEGWTATVDGADTEVLFTNHTFRGVPVPAGDHRVELQFRPRRLTAGLWISSLGWLSLALFAVVRGLRFRASVLASGR